MLDFNNDVHAKWSYFGHGEIWITDSIRNTWIIGGILILFAIIVRIRLRKFTDVPKGFQNVVELAVETMHGFVSGTMGEKYSYFGNWFFGVFAFILLSNLSGLIGLRPPTADIATTFALALCSFVLIHFMGIFTQKKAYFKSYFEPNPVFFPLNLIDLAAKPISLSFRLFGNILGGLIIGGLIYGLFPVYLKIGIPAVLHVYFDIFSGCLQAFIFTILSMTFIRDRIPY